MTPNIIQWLNERYSMTEKSYNDIINDYLDSLVWGDIDVVETGM